MITAGETTSRRPSKGRSGRNQELALGAALKIDGLEGILVASMGSDGLDGPTDADDATGTCGTVHRAVEAGIDCADALVQNEAYSVFHELDDLIVSGPTDTGVADIQVVLLA